MTSRINFNNIDGGYPVAGQDNDSQGFRDNFTNIKNNLRYASEELGDLQSKVLLKSALTGTVLQNDLNYAPLYRAKLKAPAHEYRNLGVLTGSIVVSYLDADVQRITTSGPLVLSLLDFPATGTYGMIRLWMTIQFAAGQTSAAVNFPATVTYGLNKITGLTVETNGTKTVTFSAAGDYMFELSTADGGVNYWIIQHA